MSKTRMGKIARLPRDIRERLNRRVQDGEPEAELLQWLNTLPELQAESAPESGGRPVDATDLADWQETGYRDWRVQAEAREQASQLYAEVAELKQAGEEPLTDALAQFLAAQYVLAAKTAVRQARGEPVALPTLQALCNDLVALRRGDHYVQRLRLEGGRLALAEREFELQHTDKLDLGLDDLAEAFKANPEAMKLYHQARDLVVSGKK